MKNFVVMLNCCMWGVDNTEVCLREKSGFLFYYPSCQLVPESGIRSLFVSSVEWKYVDLALVHAWPGQWTNYVLEF